MQGRVGWGDRYHRSTKVRAAVAEATCLTVTQTQTPSLGLQHVTGCPRGRDWQPTCLPSSELGPARGIKGSIRVVSSLCPSQQMTGLEFSPLPVNSLFSLNPTVHSLVHFLRPVDRSSSKKGKKNNKD